MNLPRSVAAAASCWVACALGAVAQDAGDGAAVGGSAPAEVVVPVQPAPAAAPAPADGRDGKLPPLPPAPLLLEKVMRGFLDGGPARETLDDVMRRAAVRNRAAAEAAERKQMVRQQVIQFEQMLQPLLAVELAFVRRSCGSLSPEVRRELLTTARQALHDVAERMARAQFEGVEDGAAGPLDVRRAIHETVSAALEPRAGRDEFTAYRREARLRHERREEAARIRIVAKIDEQLGLSAAQRAAMLEDLRARWQPDWIRELEDHDGMMINDQPPAPDFAAACIEPHLDPAQRQQWRQWSGVASSSQIPRSSVDWSELNAIQQGQQKLDAWWRP